MRGVSQGPASTLSMRRRSAPPPPVTMFSVAPTRSRERSTRPSEREQTKFVPSTSIDFTLADAWVAPGPVAGVATTPRKKDRTRKQ